MRAATPLALDTGPNTGSCSPALGAGVIAPWPPQAHHRHHNQQQQQQDEGAATATAPSSPSVYMSPLYDAPAGVQSAPEPTQHAPAAPAPGYTRAAQTKIPPYSVVDCSNCREVIIVNNGSCSVIVSNTQPRGAALMSKEPRLKPRGPRELQRVSRFEARARRKHMHGAARANAASSSTEAAREKPPQAATSRTSAGASAVAPPTPASTATTPAVEAVRQHHHTPRTPSTPAAASPATATPSASSSCSWEQPWEQVSEPPRAQAAAATTTTTVTVTTPRRRRRVATVNIREVAAADQDDEEDEEEQEESEYPRMYVVEQEPEKRKRRRGAWTPKEDELLLKYVAEFGTKEWTSVALKVPNRTSKQCRERYTNCLAPNIWRGPWSTEEDECIRRAVHVYGKRWANISRSFMPERPANAVKNRWHAVLRKNDDEWLKQHQHQDLLPMPCQPIRPQHERVGTPAAAAATTTGENHSTRPEGMALPVPAVPQMVPVPLQLPPEPTLTYQPDPALPLEPVLLFDHHHDQQHEGLGWEGQLAPPCVGVDGLGLDTLTIREAAPLPFFDAPAAEPAAAEHQPELAELDMNGWEDLNTAEFDPSTSLPPP